MDLERLQSSPKYAFVHTVSLIILRLMQKLIYSLHTSLAFLWECAVFLVHSDCDELIQTNICNLLEVGNGKE